MVDALGTSPAPVPVQDDSRNPLGQVLLERGFLTNEQLQNALAEQERTGLPIGQVLISLSYVTAATIAQALATQHGGLLKTEYGFATGFDATLAVEAPSAPPLSPVQAPVGGLRIAEPSPAVQPEPALATVAPLPNAGLAAAPSRTAELEIEIASARQAEQAARQEEMLARQQLAAAQASGDQLGAAAARIVELEQAYGEMRRQLQASMERSEQLERELSEMRMGAVDELQRTQHELAMTTENLRAAYARLHEYERAAAFEQQPTPSAQPARAASPYAWQT